MVPSPYSVRWTSKLICRDLRELSSNCTSKLKSFFSTSANASAYTPHVQVEIELPIDTGNIHDDATTSLGLSFDSSTYNDSNMTTPTRVVEEILEPSNTLYSLLTTTLKTLYTSRCRDAPLENRWAFRGAWLLLDMATQWCASNPSFDILRGGYHGVDEAALLLEVLQHSVSKPLHMPTTKISQVPKLPYTNYNDDSTRRDSGYDSPPSPPSPDFLWYTVLAGATDHTKTICAAEYLLGHAWPEKDATVILDVVGNPAKRLSEDESTELRNKLGHLLYPEYDALC